MTDPVALLEEAGNKLLAAMEMQEWRELETLHISQPTAKHLWDAAKAEWAAAIALMRAPAGDDKARAVVERKIRWRNQEVDRLRNDEAIQVSTIMEPRRIHEACLRDLHDVLDAMQQTTGGGE